MLIEDHRLLDDAGTPVPLVESPNRGGPITPEFLLLHFTADRSAESTIRWLTDPASRASAHLVIGRDGAVTQLVRFDTAAWHAGVSRWLGREGLNQWSIGIELDNAGRLVREGDRWRAWFRDAYPDEEVLEATHRYERSPSGWHVYTTRQLEVALAAGVALARHYRLRDVLGHDDAAPGRKVDPGPAFPLPSYRTRVLGRDEDTREPLETSVTLNIRTGPGTQYPTIPGSPLAPATPVDVLLVWGSWHLVDVLRPSRGVMDMQGWVHGRYLRPLRWRRAGRR